MNIEKIKELLIEYKKYILICVISVVVLIFFKQGNNDNKNTGIESQNSSLLADNKQSASSMSDTTGNTESKAEPKEVTCDISGAVNNEGVYTLSNGARLDELIKAAGGLRKNAQVKAINRALILKDQQKIHIPFKGEKVDNSLIQGSSDNSASSDSPDSDSKSGNKVNLNTATSSDLQKLNGIGEKKAEQIIAYREQKGDFKKIEDLMQVSGIGEKTFAALKDQLTI